MTKWMADNYFCHKMYIQFLLGRTHSQSKIKENYNIYFENDF